jgi:hypothetical protein
VSSYLLSSIPAALHATAVEQDFVLSRAQLRAVGIDADRVRNQRLACRWQVIGRHAIVLHSGPPTVRQQLWIALLHGGPGAILAGRTAARAGGLRGWERASIEVHVPRGARIPPLDGATFRSSSRSAANRVAVGTPPRLPIAHALIDAAAHERHIRTAAALLAAGVQQRLVPAPAIRAALEEVPRMRGRQLLRAVLHDIEGGAHALSEIDFGRLARRAGLPPPLRQAIRRDSYGRRRYLDADFGAFAAEVDGAVHLLPTTYWDDMARQNELVLTGLPVLRFSSVAVRTEPERVITQLRRAGMRWPAARAVSRRGQTRRDTTEPAA